MILNYFREVFNFIFPKEKINTAALHSLLDNRSFYFPKKNLIVFFPYKNTFVRKAIWLMKFKNNFSVADFFGNVLYEQLPEILESLSLQENFNDPVLVTIPITLSKKISRKYNQNDIVIDAFMRAGGNTFIQWEKNILVKSKNTQPQSRIRNKQERIKNVKNSFAVKHAEKIQGKNIVLFDDVTTTGATLSEAAKVLRKAGAKKIIYLTLAH